ncbi:class I SAM-dependent methyltransferase [Kordiimonas laminariae]|uniref:class I SAM-dependent methyltransferase n=1 Tax=Kordiimonas laminariae TaxID=2917717 RepID=UPI001FF46B8F|nr:class I SAM-dependent methyltransferase [Kordiimonas laminariae]MCK0068351.1 class I SAM-dependent methyltransferase [Kordiimonas laminariae]
MNTSSTYYSNINTELLDICHNATNVIEFGCGEGQFLRRYKEINPASRCVGFELFEPAANVAKQHLDHIIVGNAEERDLGYDGYTHEHFDLIIYGDVLEHFIDPWTSLKRHSQFLKSGGHVCACIPNTSHWSIIFNLVNGQFPYADAGLLDKTHLRFFTKATIISMFEACGFELEFVKPRKFQTQNTNNAIKQLAKLFNKPAEEISHNRIEDWSTFQFLVKAKKI